jgi:hypothetical protein
VIRNLKKKPIGPFRTKLFFLGGGGSYYKEFEVKMGIEVVVEL